MSTSKFLPFQDVNGDGLPDVCDEVYVEEVQECPSKCTPNPRAIVPKWRGRKNFQPFLNEKVCKYQITITAADDRRVYHDTGIDENDSTEQAEAKIKEIYDRFVDRAVEILLQFYNKQPSEGAIELLKGEIEYTSFFLDPRPNSVLKLLYSVDHDILQSIVEAAPSDEDTGETSPIEVTYVAAEIGPMMIRLRKALRLYSRFAKVYAGLEGSSIRFVEGNAIFDLEPYGDAGYTTSDSVMNLLTEQLSDFLSTYGYNIPSISGYFRNVGSSFRGLCC